jgi:hypothetical protein
MVTDLEWGRRRATRVEGAAAEVEGYRQFAARRKFFFHCLAGGYGVEPGKGDRDRVEQEGRKDIGGEFGPTHGTAFLGTSAITRQN